MLREVKFHDVNDVFGEFSAFAPYPIGLEGKTWPTIEHYFQAHRFDSEKLKEEIRRARSPREAAEIARAQREKQRRDWNRIKVETMRESLAAKFRQHPSLMALLLGTGTSVIREHTLDDDYWGDGGDGCGKNMMAVFVNIVVA